MAEIPMSGQGAANGRAQSFGTLTNYAGAVVSLGLIVGIGVWGYSVLSRDVSGVPVVRAASNEPMRVAPENPGGEAAAHQGLAVNKVMAEGGAEKPADRLVLAPQPVQLTDEDEPMGEMAAPQKIARPAPLPEAALTEVSAEPLTEQMSSIQALAEQLSKDAKPLAAPEPQAETITEVAALAPIKPQMTAPVTEPAAAKPAPARASGGTSLRPKLRPAALNTAAPVSAPARASAASPVAAVQGEVDVASIAAGTRLVQLGAFESAEVARKEWVRLSGRFEDYMDGKSRVVMRAKSGGRVFYRLRAMGFADLSDARRFCAALVAEKADCIPVVAK